MKHTILVACSIVVLSGLSAAAQTPQPQPQPLPQTPPTQQTPPAEPSPSPAQRPPDPDRPTATPPRPMADVAASKTVTGCLKTWDSRTMAPALGAGSGAGSAASQTSGAASGSTPTTADFVLTNVEGAAAGAAKGSFLLSTAETTVSFAQHLNHKVTVTGTVKDAAGAMGQGSNRMGDQPTADKPGAARDASASGRVAAGDAKLPMLNVSSITMVSPTCGS